MRRRIREISLQFIAACCAALGVQAAGTALFDFESGKLVDPGHFYAAQKFSDIPKDDGRTIVMARQRRMEFPQPATVRAPIIPTKVQPFNGQLTFPVEITLRENDGMGRNAGCGLQLQSTRGSLNVTGNHRGLGADDEQPVL